MINLDDLFIFPIIMVDGHNEEMKEKRSESLALEDTDEEVDLIVGEAECPYYDFISVADRWLPTQESLDKALSGKFEACFVQFGTSGSYVVPWTKKKFKKQLQSFIDERPKEIDITLLKNEDND